MPALVIDTDAGNSFCTALTHMPPRPSSPLELDCRQVLLDGLSTHNILIRVRHTFLEDF